MPHSRGAAHERMVFHFEYRHDSVSKFYQHSHLRLEGRIRDESVDHRGRQDSCEMERMALYPSKTHRIRSQMDGDSHL